MVGDSFTPRTAVAFAQAFGTFVRQGAVVVGRDTRTSGPMIEHAVAAGLQSVGCKPILVGVVPTPTVLMATKALGAQGGIAITASHNPAPWNALKFVEHTGLFLDAHRAEELYDIYHQGDFPLVAEADIPGVGTCERAMDIHVEKVLDYVFRKRIIDRHFKVAVDCCNGAGALHTVKFLQEGLGCEVVPILDAPTGVFEREPEPTPANLQLLCQAVRDHGCDIGFAQDPDADRLAIVNEKGEPIGEDLSLAFAVKQVLKYHRKGPVAINLSTSKCVEHVAHECGCEVRRTAIGEINVTTTMLEQGAVVGGEGNGGVIVPAVHACRDSYIGMALALELMAMEGKSVSGLRAEIPELAVVKEKIQVRSDQSLVILRALRRQYEGQNMNLLDGVHVDFGDSWIHARRSNTEPIVRLMAEAPTRKKAERLCAELRAHIENALPCGR